MTTPPDFMPAGRLSKLSGLPVATIHRLARKGHLVTHDTGITHRRYEQAEVPVASIVAQLRSATEGKPKLSMQKVKACLPQYREAVRHFQRNGGLANVTIGIDSRDGRLVWAGKLLWFAGPVEDDRILINLDPGA